MKRGFFARFSNQSEEQKYQSLAQARGVSEIGNSVRQVILALAILSVRSRQQDLFLAEVLESCGFFLMSILAPFFIDQVRKLRALIWSDILCLGNALLLIVGVSHRNLTLLLVGSFLMTFIASLYSSVLYAVTASYTGTDKHLIRAGLSYLQRNILIGGLVGLLATSLSLSHLPLVTFLIFDAGTFLVSSFWIFLVTRKDLSNEVSRRRKFVSLGDYLLELMREWNEGFGKVLSTPDLRRIFGANFLICYGYGILESSVVSTQKLVLGFSHGLVTFSRALNRLSAIGGTMLVSKWSKNDQKKGSREVLRFGFKISFVGTALMVIPQTLAFISANTFYNLGWSTISPTLGAAVAAKTPAHLLGRVQAFRSLVINLSILLGNLTVLAFGSMVPVQSFFAVTSGCFALTFLVFGSRRFLKS